MDTLPAKRRRLNLSSDPHQSGISNTRNDHNLTNNIHGDSNTNIGNVSHSYNTINVGVDEESLLIKTWLSPLEPERRHRDVSNRRVDGVGGGFYRRTGSSPGAGVKIDQGTLPCYVMEVKGLARPL